MAPRAPSVDMATKAIELRGMGFSDEQAAEYLTKLSQAQNPDLGVVDVWEDNWDAFQVFPRCQWNTAVGATAVIFLGLSAQEIRTAADALGIPFTADLLDDVQTMANAAAQVLNKRK